MRSLTFLFLGLSLCLSAEANPDKMRTGRPMLYNTSLIHLSQMRCEDDVKLDAKDLDGNSLVTLCPKEYKNCGFNGSCVLEKTDGTRMTMNVLRQPTDQFNDYYFFIVEPKTCIYGYGIGLRPNGRRGQTCLDPYFSMNADMKEHRLGDVIFMPSLVGVKLPTGETHDGYLIVRETHRSLDDRGFDTYAFFTGLEGDTDLKRNPFLRLSLDNIDYPFKYQVVSGEKAAEIRKKRNYPGLIGALRKAYYR